MITSHKWDGQNGTFLIIEGEIFKNTELRNIRATFSLGSTPFLLQVTVDGESYDLNSSFVGDTTERELHYKANFPLFDEFASTSFAMMLNPKSVFAELIPVNPGSILREYITSK